MTGQVKLDEHFIISFKAKTAPQSPLWTLKKKKNIKQQTSLIFCSDFSQKFCKRGLIHLLQ